jgi:hypothetical protein
MNGSLTETTAQLSGVAVRSAGFRPDLTTASSTSIASVVPMATRSTPDAVTRPDHSNSRAAVVCFGDVTLTKPYNEDPGSIEQENVRMR